MSRHVVVGTAGHVDHGKTALVKALTGVDADRWEEEKRRGITIDLGFAKLDMGEGRTASVVDVPGHEDFVRNMVAGATGVDIVLLVVAADEGLMPQTHEHLAILEFLGVCVGVVAITKCDLVDEEWLDLVEEDVRETLAGSSIDWGEAPVRVSSVSGQGIDQLLALLAVAADSAADRSESDLFRLPVDRVFSIAGAGTVVTGTTWSGSVNVGDEVKILPGEGKARVRGVEVHDESFEFALPGRRTALALAGLNRSDVERGHTVVADPAWRATTAVDALVTLLPGVKPLTQRSRVRFHLGTAEVMSRLTPVDPELVGETTGPVRFRLEAPVVCRWGDRGVLRSYSPVTTIGGCVVVDPFPDARPRRPVNLGARAVVDSNARLLAYVDLAAESGLSIKNIPVRVGIPQHQLADIVRSLTGVVRAGDRLFSPSAVQNARDATIRVLTEYHQKHTLEPGMPRDLLRQVVPNNAFVEKVHSLLESDGEIAIDGQFVRLKGFQPELSKEQERWAKALMDELEEAGALGRTLKELATVVPPECVQELVAFHVGMGTTVRVGKDRYYDKEELDKLISTVLETTGRLGKVTPADLREETGLSRKYLIPLLEWMDGRSLTVRQGDARILGPSAPAH